MTFDFQKLGVDRISQNIKRAVNNPTSNVTTGDITRGEVVAVEFTAETEVTKTVTSRRTGAVLINNGLDSICEIVWTYTGTNLTVTLSAARTGSLEFWVF